MVIQALIVSSLLDDRPFREAPPWMVILFSAGVTLPFSLALLMRPRALFPILTWLAVGAGYLLSCVLLFAMERTILPAGLPLILWAAAGVFVLVVRRRLRFITKEGGSS